MPDYNKLMDRSMDDNLKALSQAKQNGSKVDAIANKHSQVSKIHMEDKSVQEDKE